MKLSKRRRVRLASRLLSRTGLLKLLSIEGANLLPRRALP
jgi:hypothetical protein